LGLWPGGTAVAVAGKTVSAAMPVVRAAADNVVDSDNSKNRVSTSFCMI
jgi:hypothetical protein